MSDFKAKMYQIHSPIDLLSLFKAPTSKGRDREEGGKGNGGEKKKERSWSKGRKERGTDLPDQR